MKVLTAVSLLELTLQLIGARKAIRDGIPYDAPIGRGKPEDVARDMWATGSGLSAPWHTLVAHAAGTAMLIARPRPWVRRAVAWLGALYILGISWERITRESFGHPDLETAPLIASGLVLSVAMALIGLGRKRR